MVVFDSTPLPAQSNTSNTSYQPIAPRPTQPVPPNGEEHGTQNVFRVEPPKRKKTNRKKKDNHEEEPQLMEIGSMVLGPMGPSFALLPSLQSNSRPRSGTRERQNSTVDSTMSQSRGSSSRPQTAHGPETQEHRNRTVDLTGPEPQPRASSRPMPPRPPTSDVGLNVCSMILGPMGPSIAVLPSVQSNSHSQRNGAQTREQRVRTVDSTERQSESRGPSSRPLPLRPQIEQPRERQISTVDLTEPGPQSRNSSSRPLSCPQIEHRIVVSTEPGPQSRSSSRPMPSRPRIEHGAETRERLRTANPTGPEPQSQGSSSQPPPTNEEDLQKYVSRCWDAGCTSCRSYSLRP